MCYTLADAYYGVILKYESRIEKFVVMLGNGLVQELSREDFVILPLRYGKSPLDDTAASANFQEALRSL